MTALVYVLTLLLIGNACGAEPGRKTDVSTTVNQLEAEFSVLTPVVKNASEFAVQVLLTNKSPKNMRVNTMFLTARLVLEVRQITGERISSGSLGFPKDDDGEIDRKVLAPSQALSYKFTGTSYFGSPLKPGKYKVRFVYENSLPKNGDWTGIITTEWLDFEVVKP